VRDVLKGFLLLRFLGLLVLAIVVTVVLGIRSLARGSDAVGVSLLVGALLLTATAGSLVDRRDTDS